MNKKNFGGTFAAEILEEEKKNCRYNGGDRVGLQFVLNLTAIYLEFQLERIPAININTARC